MRAHVLTLATTPGSLEYAGSARRGLILDGPAPQAPAHELAHVMQSTSGRCARTQQPWRRAATMGSRSRQEPRRGEHRRIEMNRQSAGAQLRLGMPLAAIRDAVAQVGEGGEERLYLEVPLALLQAAMPEVTGHHWVGGDGRSCSSLTTATLTSPVLRDTRQPNHHGGTTMMAGTRGASIVSVAADARTCTGAVDAVSVPALQLWSGARIRRWRCGQRVRGGRSMSRRWPAPLRPRLIAPPGMGCAPNSWPAKRKPSGSLSSPSRLLKAWQRSRFSDYMRPGARPPIGASHSHRARTRLLTPGPRQRPLQR